MRHKIRPDTQIKLGPRKFRLVSRSGRNMGTWSSRAMAAKRGRYATIKTQDQNEFWCDAIKNNADPTGTSVVRHRFSSMFDMRLRLFRKVLREAVVNQDILGMKPGSRSPLAMASSGANRMIGFQNWVEQQLVMLVSENGQWLRPMIATPYNRAVVRGMRLTAKSVSPEASSDVIDAMVQLSFAELRGILDTLTQRIVRAGAIAYMHKGSPTIAFNEMDTAINKIGKLRTRALVEMMVVKAFTMGTLDQFEKADIKMVGVIAEMSDAGPRGSGPGSRISRTEEPSRSTIGRIRRAAREVEKLGLVNIETAGDDKVCPVCEDLEESGPYTIDEARSLIPAHPWCRCALFPVNGGPEIEVDR